MSIVLKKTKRLYQTVLLVEIGIFFLAIVFFSIVEKSINETVLSFFVGLMAIFLPYLFSILLMFFRQQVNQPLSRFYKVAAFKFSLTVVFIIMAIKFFAHLDHSVFFLGCILSLVLNSILPLVLNHYGKQ
ncbi:hypothetical protein A4G19_04470 [Pasteurellaceae bacterium Macca]|nr:hypothetical protein [Pasteurellaceae bacterium Macca]